MESFFHYFMTEIKFQSVEDFFQYMALDVYDWVLIFAGLFLLIEILDEVFTKRFSGERLLETLSSLLTQIPYYLTEVFIFSFAVYGYFVIYEYIPWKIPANEFTFLIVLLLADFTYYVEHYCLHKVRLLWGAHSVHHSSPVMNTATAFRFSMFDPIVSAVFHLPLLLMGFNPVLIFAAEILIQAYQFWIHNEMIGKLGPLEWIFNTPSHHRVHHGSDKEYIDTNYGGILIIWDRIFGTFAKEEKLPKYGLTTPINTKNPLRVQFFEFIKMYRDIREAKNFSEVCGYLFKSPGWSPSQRKNLS